MKKKKLEEIENEEIEKARKVVKIITGYFNYTGTNVKRIKLANDEENTTQSSKGQPLLRGKFSSGMVLQNEYLPIYINHMLNSIMLMKRKDNQGVIDLYASMWAVFNFLAFIIEPNARKEIYNALQDADSHYDDWDKKQFARFPTQLAKLLNQTAQQLIYNYHVTGLGIEYERYEPRSARINKALGLT